MSEVKENLKRIAIETVRREGIQGITFRDLGAAVGIKSSSVIYHFESKAQLLQEIAREYGANFFEELSRIRAENTGVLERLDGLVEIFQRSEDVGQLCLCGMFAAEHSQLDEETRQYIRSFFLDLERWVAEVLMESEKPPTAPPEMTATLLVSSLEGALLLDLTEEKTRRLGLIRSWIGDRLY